MRLGRYWLALGAVVVALLHAEPAMSLQSAPTAPTAVPQVPVFTGNPIDVDYQGALLRVVLRQLAEIGGINLVLDPSVPVNAAVDLKLTQVPWDQVMDVVMKSAQLTYIVDGPVVRVLTREARGRELKDEVEQKKASESAPALESVRLKLNHASAAVLKKLLEQVRVLSARGTAEVDERTNMLIVKDLPAALAEIRQLVADLDQPEPQVEIEARILQMSRDTARALGAQLGVNGRVSPELGNTTSLAFPNRGTLSGRVIGQGPVTQSPNDPRAGELEKTGTAVNLPIGAATSALGLSLGAVNGAFAIDAALSTLEHEGKVQILSQPRVTTQNNRPAEMAQGFQIPFQTVANNTVTVQFRDAALKLVVTPQITADTVIMHIVLENGTPDFSRAVNGNPSINTQRADTQVQVRDGMTTVIGGITQSTESRLVDSTPGASRIPLLGWLFKRTDTRTETRELLIFITPRIIRSRP
jgi:type IV pilus assembly protein PilQ